ncbi:MAG: tRNA epoxyqueuosine(34) reductase QueG [bacterium]|nr:tRNA epoxyqueuosine(34) reductase QueG [bacterium]
MPTREATITGAALALGFARAGCTPLAALGRDDVLAAWLAEGRAGDMAWLGTAVPARLDPRVQHPWARSLVTVAYPYRPPAPPPVRWREELRGRVAAYALGSDYHGRVRTLLRTLAGRLAATFPGATFRAEVDTAPLLEREWAARGGVGWIGKHTLVLERGAGSWFLLGELLTDLELETGAPAGDHCGGCTRCLASCPTDALRAYRMDPRRCISYLTIEHRGAIPPPLRPAMDGWIFGCDLCQEACPWNRERRDEASAELLAPFLPALLTLDADAFRSRFAGTVLARPGRRGLLRNVCVALGNTGNPAAVPALAGALASDPEALVRGHAAWGLGRLGGAPARRALERARRDGDGAVRDEVDAALAALR